MLVSLALALGCDSGIPARRYVDTAGVKHEPVPTMSEDGSLIPTDKSKRSQEETRVLIFTTVDCPIANGYAPQINQIVKDYTDKHVAFFLVHVDSDVTTKDAREHAKDYGYTCPVILDPEHKIVNFVGATMTPEACVFTREGKLAYLGRINDWYAGLGKKRFNVRNEDLRNALDAVLAGREVATPRTKVIGCNIPER